MEIIVHAKTPATKAGVVYYLLINAGQGHQPSEVKVLS